MFCLIKSIFSEKGHETLKKSSTCFDVTERKHVLSKQMAGRLFQILRPSHSVLTLYTKIRKFIEPQCTYILLGKVRHSYTEMSDWFSLNVQDVVLESHFCWIKEILLNFTKRFWKIHKLKANCQIISKTHLSLIQSIGHAIIYM